MLKDPVDLVHRQLECLKYIGGHRNGEPTGQGIEIDIVLLPDLLLDFRAYNVRGQGTGETCAVGGRAARTACALLHLLSDEDGTFRVHLFTKTGNLGRLLLENEFHGTEAEQISSQCHEGVEVRRGEPRCAIWNKDGSPPTTKLQTRSSELRPQDLRKLSAQRIMRHARTVCLSSVNTPHFPGLFCEVLKNITGNEQGLFLDAARARPKHLRKLLGLLGNLEIEDKTKLLGIFVPGDIAKQLTELSGATRLEAFCRSYHVPVIHYGAGDRVVYVGPDGQEPVEVPCQAGFRHEDIPERFKAGVLLASSVFRTLPLLKREAPRLYKCLTSQWPQDKPAGWEHILHYGVCLATAGTGGRTFCSLRPLVDAANPNGSDHFSVNRNLLPIEFETQGSADSSEMVLSHTVPRKVATLAGLRRTSNLECKDLPLCDGRKNCGAEECQQTGRSLASPAAAVLIDLDGTLMDSTEQRNRGLAVALADLARTEPKIPKPNKDIEARVDFFTQNVYDLWKLFKAMELGDFRQEWNHPGWYVTYIVFAENEELRCSILDWWRRSGHGAEDRTLQWRLEEASWKQEFQDSYLRAADRYQDAIKKAQAAFAAARMHPLKEARDFLRSLQLTGAFSLYICSEGHPDVQWRKIRSTGLDEFFDRQHVLTTGEAAEPTRERQLLGEETRRLIRENTRITEERRNRRNWLDQLAQVENDVRIRIKDSQSLTDNVFEPEKERLRAVIRDLDVDLATIERRQRAAGFVDNLLTRMAHKVDIFYAAAIRAILRGPRSPVDELRSFRRLVDASRPDTTMKFAMVGDRQTNDIGPPTKLLTANRLLTIRLVSGTYAVREPVAQVRALWPKFIARTLAQAKAILLSKNAWNDIACAGDPPIFNWRVDIHDRERLPTSPDEPVEPTVGLNHILCGMEMPAGDYPTISKICTAVVAEFLDGADAKIQKEILRPYIEPGGEGRAGGTLTERVRVLCCIVRGGAAKDAGLWACAEAFVDRLSSDVERLLREIGAADPDTMAGLEALSRLAAECPSKARKEARKRLRKIRHTWGI